MSHGHSPFGEFRNPLGDDDFTELHDANVPRMDLVSTAANGSRFLLMKSAGGTGLIDATDVRQLVSKKTPSKAKEPIVHTYLRNGRKIVSPKRLTNTELDDAVRKAAKGSGTLVAVYDQTGKLIGTMDQKDLIPISRPVDPNAPKPSTPKATPPESAEQGATRRIAQAKKDGAAPVTPADATDGPAAVLKKAIDDAAVIKAAEVFAPMVRDLNETLAGVRFSGDSSAFARGTTEQRFAKLSGTVNAITAGHIADAVARGAMSGMFGAGFSTSQAVSLAKRVALDAASFHADHVREAPEAMLKRVHERGPRI